MLVIVAVVVLLVLAFLLAIAFDFFIYKDWQRSHHISDVDQKLYTVKINHKKLIKL